MASSLLRPARVFAPLAGTSRLKPPNFRSFSVSPTSPSDSSRSAPPDASAQNGQVAEIIELLRSSHPDPPPAEEAWTTSRNQEVTRESHLADIRKGSFTLPYQFSLKYATRPGRVGRPPRVGPDARAARDTDVFAKLRLDPLREATNARLMSSFVTEMGKLKGRPNTNLTRKSQRRLAKAVRRAKMMGLMPVLSRMPALKSLSDKKSPQNQRAT